MEEKEEAAIRAQFVRVMSDISDELLISSEGDEEVRPMREEEQAKFLIDVPDRVTLPVPLADNSVPQETEEDGATYEDERDALPEPDTESSGAVMD